MTTASIILASLLAVAAVVWVARPFLYRTEGEADEAVPDDPVAAERLRLMEERDRALAALKELEFDNRTGKLSDSDYRQLVGPLRGEAAAAIAGLDRLATSESLPESERPPPPADAHPMVERPREEQPH